MNLNPCLVKLILRNFIDACFPVFSSSIRLLVEIGSNALYSHLFIILLLISSLFPSVSFFLIIGSSLLTVWFQRESATHSFNAVFLLAYFHSISNKSLMTVFPSVRNGLVGIHAQRRRWCSASCSCCFVSWCI